MSSDAPRKGFGAQKWNLWGGDKQIKGVQERDRTKQSPRVGRGQGRQRNTDWFRAFAISDKHWQRREKKNPVNKQSNPLPPKKIERKRRCIHFTDILMVPLFLPQKMITN